MTTERPVSRSSKKRLWLPVAFVAGLLLGWLGIGWWLWPVQWSSVAPPQLAPPHQRAYLTAVAEAYALTGDVTQVQARLATWDDAALAEQLSLLIQETADPIARDRYMALGEALAMPMVATNLLDMLLGQKVVVVSAVAALGLFVVALGLAALPVVQKVRARQLAEASELALVDEATGRDGANGRSPDAPIRATAPSNPDATPPDNQSPATEVSATAVSPTPTEGDASAGGVGPIGAAPNGQPPAPRPPMTAPPEQSATAVIQPGLRPPVAPNEPQQPENAPQKLLEDTPSDIQDLLTSVFDDDDKFAHYDVLLRDLDDRDVLELAAFSEKILRRLRVRNRISNP